MNMLGTAYRNTKMVINDYKVEDCMEIPTPELLPDNIAYQHPQIFKVQK